MLRRQVAILFCFCLGSALPFSSTKQNGICSVYSIRLEMASSSSAFDLLYQDQQEAMLRRAVEEEQLLLSNRKAKELKAPKLKAKPPKSGTGFGGGSKNQMSTDPAARLALEQAKVLDRNGVLRIDNVMSGDLADRLRDFVLQQQALAEIETEKDVSLSKAFYGVENARKNRCDLQLSLLKGGYKADRGGVVDESEPHTLVEALSELLGVNGTLRPIYEHLVTNQGEFYELAAVVTDPGSNRQQVHPDLPHQSSAPLYVIFLALQDIKEDMGPTTFLLKTHTKQENAKFMDQTQKDEQLKKADWRLSTLKKGDAVMFDARILHCGNANDPLKGSTRVMLNFSFRNPEITGNLGYPGSIRPGYCEAINLATIGEALAAYNNGDKEPFAKYGDGLSRKHRSYN